jgi:hypothetical protein
MLRALALLGLLAYSQGIGKNLQEANIMGIPIHYALGILGIFMLWASRVQLHASLGGDVYTCSLLMLFGIVLALITTFAIAMVVRSIVEGFGPRRAWN